MHPAPRDGGALEDHLRNLILNNSETMPQQQQQAPILQAAMLPPHTSPPTLQPIRGPPEQGLGYGLPLSSPPNDSALGPTQGPQGTGPAPKGPRKRLNQAQRRQMSAQLSIPIDPRPPPPQYGRQYFSPPPLANYQQPPFQQRAQRPQSATVRPSYHGHASMNAPLTGLPFPPQPRHHQSLSYHGPISYGDPYGWREQHGQQPQQHPQYGYSGPISPLDAPSPSSARSPNAMPFSQNRQHHQVDPDEMKKQIALLETLCQSIIINAEIEPAEIQEKENFRLRIEHICRDAITSFERECHGIADFPPLSVQLRCFGSLSSGFATKASDMDLGLLSPLSPIQPDAPNSPIPRLVEKAFLNAGLGARLLSRTRVPIIKLCEKPPEKLRLDLLDERTRWETGILPELDHEREHDDAELEEDVHDEGEPASTPSFDENAPSSADARHGHSNEKPDGSEEPGSEGYSQKLASLRQPQKQSLSNYYNAAKRLLRKLGGHDVTHSTVRNFTKQDYQILTDVCHAFVRGLADEELKKRLQAVVSLKPSGGPSQPSSRSLAGVYAQVEGEKLAMMWDAREVNEKDQHREREAQNKIKHWNEIQNKVTFGLDPLGYNKEVLSGIEYLKKIPSIQIMSLAQGQYESPSQYHMRATRLLLDLGAHDTHAADSHALSVVTRHYVAGIWNPDIRSQVGQFLQSEEAVTLRAVARRHKTLQLALEFEKALDKGLYDPSSINDIRAYVALLRGPMEMTALSDRYSDYILVGAREAKALISRIRQLPDPSQLAPNQPRDPYKDRLEFPKTGAGVQCDINFSAHLALQNTLLLRCYSHTDPRVRPMVLFVKHWAKVRGINTPYRGTLSSYGYVLMVLHYLVNIAQPFVCPNLQHLARPPSSGGGASGAGGLPPGEADDTFVCKGRNVQFWRDEDEIKMLAAQGALNKNHEPVGRLLRGFFEYYAQSGFMTTVPCRGFDWGRDVLSLRTIGGLRTKQEKGWTGAKTVIQVQGFDAPTPTTATAMAASPLDHPLGQGRVPLPDAEAQGIVSPVDGKPAPAATRPAAPGTELKEVRHRFLFAIEDPFELDHNVARTVTHNGIVAIRDEFRRAWRIIKNAGRSTPAPGSPQENLLEDAAATRRERDAFQDLLDDIHGRQ